MSGGNLHTMRLSFDEVCGALSSAGARAHLYQHPHWLRVVKEGLGSNVEGLLTRDGENNVATTPYFKIKKGPLAISGSPLRGTFTPYLGPVWLREMTLDERCRILEQQHTALKKNAAYVEWSFSSEEDVPGRFLQKERWVTEHPQTLVLHILPDEDAMWKKMESRARNMVRKAEKSGVTVEKLKGTPEDISGFYGMLESTFAKSGMHPPHPKRFYEAMTDILMPEGKLLFLAALAEGKKIAFGFFPFDGYEMHYLSGSSLPEYNKLAPNNLMQWEVIRFAVQKKISVYDLGGTGIGAIDKFKASFGGQPKSYLRLIWMPSFLKKSYEALLKTRPAARKLKYRLTAGRTKHA